MLTLKKADMDDFDFFYNLKCEDHSVSWSGFSEKPDRDKLYNYFQSNVMRESKVLGRQIYIIMDQDSQIGYISIDPLDKIDEFDMPIGICKAHLGKGYASKALQLGIEEAKRQGYKIMRPRIREDNLASMKAYKKCGAVLTGTYETIYVPDKDDFVKMYDLEIKL